MKEIFISHSSVNKDFALQLRDDIGHDRTIIDCADFEPANKSASEITAWFNECKIFVLLLSPNALTSDWVEYEIQLAYERFYSPRRKGFRFIPMIVDSSINHKSASIPEWIRDEECFNLKFFRSPIIAANLVLKYHRELIWKTNEHLHLCETLFVGRKKEMADFETEINRSSKIHLNGAVISGRTGVGKKAFARQCIINELKESSAFEPYVLTMREKDNIENYILQINDFVHYSKERIEKVLSSTKKEKLDEAIKMTNELYSYKGYIFIMDKMGCIGYDGQLTEWFKDLIVHPDLIKELKIFVLSEIQWYSSEASKYKNFINLNLQPLSFEERRILFNRASHIYEVFGISDKETDEIVRSLNQTPSQIVKIVREIKAHPIVKGRTLKKMLEEADSKVKTIIDPFLKNSLSRELLLILSQYEFLSYRIIQKVFVNNKLELEDIIFNLIDFNIVEEFGLDAAYLRLDASVVDYMKRSRFRLSDETFEAVQSLIEDLIQKETDIDDMSAYLIEQRRNLETQIKQTDRFNILVPSVAIKYVIDLYYAGKYNAVINLCERLLKDMHNFYHQIKRELTYWLAMSYARLGKEKELNDSLDSLGRADRLFILGFYYRKSGILDKALEYLEQARDLNYDTNKVRRELVEVHMGMGNIEEALKLAIINYKKRPDNAFHIQAYFQALNSKQQRTAEDIKLQQRLLDEMKNNNAKTARSMYDSMLKEFIIA